MEMEIRGDAQAAGERGDTRDGYFCGILTGDGTEGRIACGRIAACEGEPGRRHYAVYPEPKGIESSWT